MGEKVARHRPIGARTGPLQKSLIPFPTSDERVFSSSLLCYEHRYLVRPTRALAISNASRIVRPSPTAPYNTRLNVIAVESETLFGHPTAYSTTPASTKTRASPSDSHAFNTHNITRSFIVFSTVMNSSALRAVSLANR